MFNDITFGSNGVFSAAEGWDYVTGWGTPNISNMWTTVCPSGAAYYQLVEKIYMGYIGRPIDPSGLANMASTLQNGGAPSDIVGLKAAYSTNTTVRTMIDSIQGSSESMNVYPTTNPTAYVNALFQAIVNRAPSSAELAIYVNSQGQYAIPQQTIALTIMSNVRQNNSMGGGYTIDTIIMENKAAVAFNFTASLTPATAPKFSGDIAAATARHMLQQIGYDSLEAPDAPYNWNQPKYVSAAQTKVNTAIAAIVAGIPQ